MTEYKDVKSALASLEALEKKMYAFGHATGMLYFDSATVAPKDTIEGRGISMSVLSEESYKLLVNPDTLALMDYLTENKDLLDEVSWKKVEKLREGYDKTSKIPMNEYVEFTMLTNEAEAVWKEAKNKSDYPMFEPYLAKIVETIKRFAGYLNPDLEPYDVWLNEYEKGLTMEIADKYFDTVRKELVPFIVKLENSVVEIDDSFNKKSYSISKQKKLSRHLMDLLTMDPNHTNIAESEHPFTINFNNKDVRITTHYYKNNLLSSVFSVIHEGGHALYELNCNDKFNYTSLSGGTSMGIHESQSRFFENIIGRSEPFSVFLLTYLKDLFPAQLKDVDTKGFYQALNKAEPSLIRIEADELTYSLHIMVRYELEKRLMDGSLSTKDLPSEWNRLYKEYLGVDVPNDKMGVLQDTHWSGGSIGYFPSYSIGSAYAAQMLYHMKKDLDMDTLLAKGELKEIVDWLKERVHKYASSKTPAEIIQIACNEDFKPHYYTDYLKEKFTKVYELD